jgi:hypothetical protein
MTASVARVPCTVITGFLGSGKTTLVRHLLEYSKGKRLALIVNEFGDIGVDGEILKGCGIDTCPEENIVELANGCICCTVADDFVPALDHILSRTPRVDHILIKPVHGECGGFMVFGEALEDAGGKCHRMLGLLGHSTSFAKRKMNLGYREARLRADCPLGVQGTLVRGHEFHYARMISSASDEPLTDLADGQGNPLGTSGYRRGKVSDTFFHAIARA